LNLNPAPEPDPALRRPVMTVMSRMSMMSLMAVLTVMSSVSLMMADLHSSQSDHMCSGVNVYVS
jgi:hypothetical protein